MSVLIEHAMHRARDDDDVHTEMRKLICRRAALKLLAVYDFRVGGRDRTNCGDPTVEPGPAGAWLRKRHRLLEAMVNSAQRSPLGPDWAEYLIIDGTREGETVVWRHSIKLPGESVFSALT